MSVSGKVALVTGAARGLGRAFSDILLKNGAKLCLADINESQGQKTCSELAAAYGKSNVLFAKCDVSIKNDFVETFSKTNDTLGGIDIVINNAGIGKEMAGWESTIDVNVKGTIHGTSLALDYLRKDRGGRGGVIVNIASMAGLNPNPCGPVYGASKAAIIMFSQCWAMNPDVKSNGVRINVLAPAFAETDMVQNLRQGKDILRADIAAAMVNTVGVMSVDEVAEGVLELVTDESKCGAILKLSAKTGKSYHEV